MGIKWNATKEEYALIEKILDRAEEYNQARDIKEEKLDRVGLSMDLVACHMNGCPLNLEKLLAAKEGDFGHDVFGISRFINRKTGKLTQCFLPRCAK